jgi:hypothetical protein
MANRALAETPARRYPDTMKTEEFPLLKMTFGVPQDPKLAIYATGQPFQWFFTARWHDDVTYDLTKFGGPMRGEGHVNQLVALFTDDDRAIETRAATLSDPPLDISHAIVARFIALAAEELPPHVIVKATERFAEWIIFWRDWNKDYLSRRTTNDLLRRIQCP